MRAVQKALLERVMRGKKVRKMTEQGVSEECAQLSTDHRRRAK